MHKKDLDSLGKEVARLRADVERLKVPVLSSGLTIERELAIRELARRTLAGDRGFLRAYNQQREEEFERADSAGGHAS